MNAQEMFTIMNENPVLHLATMDGDQPRVRGMLLYRADENGIVFHTAYTKDVYTQLKANPKAELCFFGRGVQIRVTGCVEEVYDDELKAEIFAHPSREFLRKWQENGMDADMVRIFAMKKCSAVAWTMETNFAEKQPVTLCC